MRGGTIRVTYALIHSLLRLPGDVRIHRVREVDGRPLEFCVDLLSETSKKLYEIHEGDILPVLDPGRLLDD